MNISESIAVYSLNPDLIDGFGHYLHYDLKIKSNLPATVQSFRIFANQSFIDSEKTSFIQSAFAKKTYDVIPAFDYAALDSFKADCSRILREINTENSGSHKVVYLYMGSVWHAWALAEVIASQPVKNAVFKINLFHDRARLLSSDFSASAYFSEYNFILQELKKRETALGLYLYADTHEAVAAFQNHFKITLPYWAMFSVSEFTKTKKEEEKNKIRFCYPGNVQQAKGFDVLAAALQKTDLSAAEFYVRTFISYLKKEAKAWIDAVPQHENVRILPGSLTVEEYSDLLINSDVILLPYRAADFGGRTSGIFADAIDLEKPVVITRETWGGNYTARYGNGVTFSDGNAEEMTGAVREVLQNFTKYKTAAKNAKELWAEVNGIENFIDELLKKTEGENRENRMDLPVNELQNRMRLHRPQGLKKAILRVKKSRTAFAVKQKILRLFSVS